MCIFYGNWALAVCGNFSTFLREEGAHVHKIEGSSASLSVPKLGTYDLAGRHQIWWNPLMELESVIGIIYLRLYPHPRHGISVRSPCFLLSHWTLLFLFESPAQHWRPLHLPERSGASSALRLKSHLLLITLSFFLSITLLHRLTWHAPNIHVTSYSTESTLSHHSALKPDTFRSLEDCRCRNTPFFSWDRLGGCRSNLWQTLINFSRNARNTQMIAHNVYGWPISHSLTLTDGQKKNKLDRSQSMYRNARLHDTACWIKFSGTFEFNRGILVTFASRNHQGRRLTCLGSHIGYTLFSTRPI